MSLTDLMPKWFLETPVGQEMAARKRDRVEAERRKAIDEIASSRQTLAEARPGLETSLEKARDAERKAFAALLSAQRRVFAASQALVSAKATADAVERRHCAMLNSTAPAAITQFRSWLQDQAQRLRRNGIQDDEIFDPDHRLGARAYIHRSNIRRVEAVLRAIPRVIGEVDVLYLKVATSEEAEAAIARLRDEIPFATLKEMDQIAPLPWRDQVIVERERRQRPVVVGPSGAGQPESAA